MAETRWEQAPARICGILDQGWYCTELRGHTGDHVAKAATAEAGDYDTWPVLHRWPQREVEPEEPAERPALMRTRVITAEELEALRAAADEAAPIEVAQRAPTSEPATGATIVPDGPRPRHVRVLLRKEDTFDVRLAIPAELAVEELSPEKVEEIITRGVFDRSALAEITPKSSEVVVIAAEEMETSVEEKEVEDCLREALEHVNAEYFGAERELLFEDADDAVHTLRNAIRYALGED